MFLVIPISIDGEYAKNEQIIKIVQNIAEFRDKLIVSGFEILDLGDNVFGKLDSNKNASSEVDIVLKDLNGNITVIDVRTGYRKISDKFDSPVRVYGGQTFREAQNEHLQDIQQILQKTHMILMLLE